jgi:hypothetical protein
VKIGGICDAYRGLAEMVDGTAVGGTEGAGARIGVDEDAAGATDIVGAGSNTHAGAIPGMAPLGVGSVADNDVAVADVAGSMVHPGAAAGTDGKTVLERCVFTAHPPDAMQCILHLWRVHSGCNRVDGHC